METIVTDLLFVTTLLFGVVIGMVITHFIYRGIIHFMKNNVKDLSQRVSRRLESIDNQLYQMDGYICDIDDKLQEIEKKILDNNK